MAEEEKERKHGLIYNMIRENAQDFFIVLSIILGLRKPLKEGETLPSGRQVPGWLLSAFPWMTDEDETEYNMTLGSHPDRAAIVAAEEFEETLKRKGKYDEVKYRIRLLKIYREFMEQTRHPAPKDESGGRLTFQRVQINDPAIEIMDRFLEERLAGGTPEEIFNRQMRIAMNRKLLEKKSFLKKLSENKLASLLFLLSLIIAIPCAIYRLIYWVLSM